jgi:hypothetical protein
MLQVAQVAVYTTHKYSMVRAYNCWMLNLLMHRVNRRLNDVIKANHMNFKSMLRQTFFVLCSSQETEYNRVTSEIYLSNQNHGKYEN